MGTFGDTIKGLRKEKGLTLMQVAKPAGVSEGYICDLEKGRRIPAYETLDKLATALSVEPMLLHQAYAKEVGYYRLPFVEEVQHRKLAGVLLEIWEQLGPGAHCKPLQRQLNDIWRREIAI